MPALLLFAMPTFAHAEVFKGVGSALHMLPVLGQTQTDATAQPQAPEKAPANRKHLNVSVGPVRMHLPISGKRPLPVTAPANGNTATGTPDLVHPVQQPLGNPSQQQEPTAKGNAPGNGGNPAGIVVVTATSVQDPTKVANVSQQPAGISNRSDTGVKGKAKSKGVYSMNDGRTDQPTRQGGTAEPQAPGAAGRIDPAVEESRQAQQAQQPGTTGSTPHDKQSYSLKVVELRGDDATAIHAAPLPAQPKGITATANSSSASGTKNAVIPNHAAPSPTQPHPGMIFDRWGNLVVEPDPEQPKMNTGVAPTQTRTNTIPVGGGSPVIIVPQGREATQTRVGPCPPHVVCRGEDAQPNKPLQVQPAAIPNPRRAPEARQ